MNRVSGKFKLNTIKCVEYTYKGDLRDFHTSVRAPMFKNHIRKLCKTNVNNNPIMILGKSGSGKTLLAKSIDGEMAGYKKTIYRITCEALINKIVDRIKSGKPMSVLIEEMSCYDIVIIDEIEELRGKKSTQYEAALVVCQMIKQGVKVILLGLPDVNVYQELLNALHERGLETKIFPLHTLNRLERLFYIVGKCRKLELRLPASGILHMSENSNMGAIVGMLNTLAAFSGNSKIVKRRGHYTYDVMAQVLGARFVD